MSAIPADVETDAQPPMTLPLRHFLVGLGFLVAGVLAGALGPLGLVPGAATLVHVHLLLVGWVCVTIMGATTQFVPVWSGTRLHSERLAAAQLWLVAAGLTGFAGALLRSRYAALPAFGALMLAGLWTFVYNVGRTLWGARPWDVTERHFAFALGCFAAVGALGLTLAASFAAPVLGGTGLTQSSLRLGHATLAVFGAVLATVVGALYQLGPMFTQCQPRRADRALRRVEEALYPAGVVALAGGRLAGNAAVARVGAVFLTVGLAAFGVAFARRLAGANVPWTPMLRRYAVVAVATLAWTALALPAWYAAPLAPARLLGPPAATHLLLLGVVGFVVFGTLYHVVPFVVWVHRYSDHLGLRDVPMVDDLYDHRLAAVDRWLLLAGGGALLAAPFLPETRFLAAAGGLLAATGSVVFAANVTLVVRDHSPRSVRAVVAPWLAGGSDAEATGSGE